MFLYFVCLYYSCLVIGGNEMGPKELPELIFMVVINLTGAIFQAYIFGELAVLIAQVGRKSQSQQERIDNANTAMENVSLPELLRKDIREYYQTILQTSAQQEELDTFINTISPSLQLRVRSKMFHNILKEQNAIIIQTYKNYQDASNPNNDKFKSLKKSMAKVERPIASDGKTRGDLFFESILQRLGTQLLSPDIDIVSQDTKEEHGELYMFWTGAGGKCKVKVRD